MRLSEAHIALVPKVAKSCFSKFSGDWQELLRAGEDGLLRAESQYQAERGTFEGFAWKCIRNAMADFLKAWNRQANRHAVLEHQPPMPEIEPMLDHRDELETLIEDASLRELLLLWVGYGMPLDELVRKSGIKRTMLHRLLTHAMEHARKKPQ